MVEFHSNPIDIDRTYANLKKYKTKPASTDTLGGLVYRDQKVSRDRFGGPVVEMAEGVISTYLSSRDIPGIRRCLSLQIKNLRWRSHLFGIPIAETRFTPVLGPSDEQGIDVELLVDSLILNIVAYRVQLDDYASGLRRIMLHDLTIGFEWLCYWVERRLIEKASENGIIVPLNVTTLNNWICG